MTAEDGFTETHKLIGIDEDKYSILAMWVAAQAAESETFPKLVEKIMESADLHFRCIVTMAFQMGKLAGLNDALTYLEMLGQMDAVNALVDHIGVRPVRGGEK